VKPARLVNLGTVEYTEALALQHATAAAVAAGKQPDTILLLVCYPILDLTRHGRDVKKYCRDLEEALIRTAGAFGVEATRIEGLTGVWLERPPRKLASIGIHLSKWVSTHGYALNVDLDPTPFTEWITACGLDGAMFTSLARELGRPIAVDEVRPAASARSTS